MNPFSRTRDYAMVETPAYLHRFTRGGGPSGGSLNGRLGRLENRQQDSYMAMIDTRSGTDGCSAKEVLMPTASRPF